MKICFSVVAAALVVFAGCDMHPPKGKLEDTKDASGTYPADQPKEDDETETPQFFPRADKQ